MSNTADHWPKAFVQQDGDRIALVTNTGVHGDATSFGPIPPWNGAHYWIAVVIYRVVDAWDPNNLLGAEHIHALEHLCAYCRRPWEDAPWARQPCQPVTRTKGRSDES